MSIAANSMEDRQVETLDGVFNDVINDDSNRGIIEAILARVMNNRRIITTRSMAIAKKNARSLHGKFSLPFFLTTPDSSISLFFIFSPGAYNRPAIKKIYPHDLFHGQLIRFSRSARSKSIIPHVRGSIVHFS